MRTGIQHDRGVQRDARRGAAQAALLVGTLALGGCTFVGDLGRDGVGDGDGSQGATDGTTGDDVGTGDTSSGDLGGGDSPLPPLPPLENVRVRIDGDAANFSFDPVDGAVDYRVYPLPDDEDVTLGPDGTVTVIDATYRCAGRREALYMLQDTLNPEPGWNDAGAGGTTVLDRDVEGFVRSEDDAVLGHVYTTDGPGRQPVYALGSSAPEMDGGLGCGRPIFASTRTKRYTADPDERDQLLAARWRDDGIAFWVPTGDQAPRRTVYEGTFGTDDVLRWVDGPEGEVRGAGTPIFEVLVEPEAGTAPLMRVHEVPYCSPEHDELVAGRPRFEKVRAEGDHPLTALRWSGITGPTVLVLEALDSGCPYQGNLSPGHDDPFSEGGFDYEGYTTPADMRAASPTGEVFINGQYDTQLHPRAIARSTVTVEPDLPTDLDMYATFPEAEDFRATFDPPTGDVYGLHHVSPEYMLSSYSASHIHFGSFLGEGWLAYNDIAAGVHAMVRLTPHQQADLSGGYLHVRTELDVVTTMVRYPQILISDQVAPVQDNLANGTTLIVQPVGYAPSYVQVQICDHVAWEPGTQCPTVPLLPTDLAPAAPMPAERAGEDAVIRLDIHLSSQRLFLRVDEQPFACTNLPAVADDGSLVGPPTGPVTVTWGDVLAHSEIDFETGSGDITGNRYVFHREHMHFTTRRHFDNIGFASGTAAPAWDESRVPCAGG